MTDEREFLLRLNKMISTARERVIVGSVWSADQQLRDVQLAIRKYLTGDVKAEPRERLVSRGLHRSRTPHMEE